MQAILMHQNHNPADVATLSNCGESEILKRGAEFALSRLQSQFLKSRERCLKNKHAGLIDELKESSKEAKNLAARVMLELDVEIDPQDVAENFAGISREWKASTKAVEQAAEEHEISMEQARDMLAASMAQAQMHCLSQRAPVLSLYEAWLADIDPASAERTDESDKVIRSVILDAYARAGEWMRRDEGLLIEGAAHTLGVILPKWADVLPKSSNVTAKQRAAINKRLDNHAEGKAKALIEAAREFSANDW